VDPTFSSRRPVLLAIVFFLAASVAPHAAQDERLEGRLERIAHIDAASATAFFEALRRNLGTGDRAAACAMVAYPLRQPGGPVTSAAECQVRYDEIFTIPVRRAVGRQQFAELFVNDDGVMIGSGELWFAGRCDRREPCREADLRIIAVNNEAGLIPPKGKMLIACRVPGGNVRVEADGTGGAQFTMGPLDAPDGTRGVHIEGGRPTPEATGLCSWRAWSFSRAAATYVVAEVGCMATPVPAPMGTVARLTRSTPGASDEGAWCFE
jgi:hypothetical protein